MKIYNSTYVPVLQHVVAWVFVDSCVFKLGVVFWYLKFNGSSSSFEDGIYLTISRYTRSGIYVEMQDYITLTISLLHIKIHRQHTWTLRVRLNDVQKYVCKVQAGPPSEVKIEWRVQ